MTHNALADTSEAEASETVAAGIAATGSGHAGAPETNSSRWTLYDVSWMFSLFGTAVGVGILYLPINAGAGGLWPLLIATILIGPMTYLSHRALAWFVCASPRKGEDITDVAKGYFGAGAGRFVTTLYMLAFYPAVLMYGVAITNTVDSFMVNQLGLDSPPRWLLSGLLIAAMMAVMLAGEKIMLVVSQFLVYPLIAMLLSVTVYLIPTWNFGVLTGPVAPGDIAISLWLVAPVMVFSFNHSPAISQFSLSMQRKHGTEAATSAAKVLRGTAGLLVLFIMAFVWSCVLSLGPDGLEAARADNLSVLSYLANVNDAPVIAFLGPIVAFAAIFSSFFGHYLGTAEGAAGIVRSVWPGSSAPSEKKLRIAVAVFIFITTWVCSILDPSVLTLIESLSGPVIAAILYLLPMYAIHKVPALEPYRGRLSNIFVTVAGVVAITAVLFNLVLSVVS